MLTLRWQFQELEAISGRHKGMNTMITGHFNELTELLRNFNTLRKSRMKSTFYQFPVGYSFVLVTLSTVDHRS